LSTAVSANNDQISEMTDADRQRIGLILQGTAAAVGGNVVWGAGSFLDVWITEHRMAAERHATSRLTFATWALVAATIVLAAATVALVVATALHK
jgi:hypothetical protein